MGCGVWGVGCGVWGVGFRGGGGDPGKQGRCRDPPSAYTCAAFLADYASVGMLGSRYERERAEAHPNKTETERGVTLGSRAVVAILPALVLALLDLRVRQNEVHVHAERSQAHQK